MSYSLGRPRTRRCVGPTRASVDSISPNPRSAMCVSSCVRDLPKRTKPLRGGRDRRIVHKPSASATRPIDSDLSLLVPTRYAVLFSGMATLGGRLGPLLHFAVVQHSSQNPPLTHLLPAK